MLARKPILESSNKIKSPTELANCGYIVKPECAKSIVEGIYYLKDLGEHNLKSLGVNGYNYVLKYHNFEFLSEKYQKLF